MDDIAQKLQLAPNELALHFQADQGIDADELGVLLRRLSTIARRKGAELRVIGLEPGSLVARLRAIGNSEIVQNAKREFVGKPIASTGIITAVTATVAGAIVGAFALGKGEVTPAAKAGAKLYEQCEVTQIDLVTAKRTYVLMDDDKAEKIKQLTSEDRKALAPPALKLALSDAKKGNLEGSVILVDRELYFQPEGFRFLVPVDMEASEAAEHIFPDAHFRVQGRIMMKNNRPDTIVIHSATQL